ncbi:helix-turn-helix transcriptional regulator [Clostridium botulinum]|uniref:Transcriptional regulator n=1 Tax=Clostridium botulinum TaxID=1491 RepID=A0A9Q1UZY3_CLOBO|nr:AraC family transcriptional regulator [Clostridium botulinum]AEB75129.1 transcriptional regulator, AraC family [Clostridium botulinum BKT015925]KEI05615.1 transcriptional regulator [Clostridium botulinum C/D str. Sp77]KLU75051.1 transcriptional regulator [Clostridium botulinum V891]KOA77200.1 transcriptional regulator [Clostridium botulinum]KOA77839.1 transcriptional regulator [Clostridium botulinum]
MTHIQEIQTALDYIEMNLHEELTLDEISKVAGFSKFYFHRIFKREVGIALYDYIRKRRLTRAASVLLNTNTSIIDIALTYQFESQESFTRAFKSVYQLPPGRYRSAIKDLIMGGINMNSQNKIKGWIITGTSPEKYQISIDDKIYHMGSKAATIYSDADEISIEEYGTIMQQISAKTFVGKRMRFSGFVKTKEVGGWCGLWMRIDGSLGVTLKFDNMQSRAITGTTEWNYYSCVLDIPENASIINIGVLLAGKGQIWFDNADLQEVDYNTPTTEFVPEEVFPDHILNQSFEEF